MYAWLLKILLYIIVILKYLPIINKDELQRWMEICSDDYSNWPNFFDENDEHCCDIFLQNVRIKKDFETEINSLFGTKKIQYGTYNNCQIILKYLIKNENLDHFKNKYCEGVTECEHHLKHRVNEDILKDKLHNLFTKEESIAGFQICPINSVTRFMEVFSKGTVYDWLLLNINVEPLVMNTLWKRHFSVPKFYTSCGFVTLQSDNGLPLYTFFEQSFAVRLLIARNVLRAALKFSYGIEGFRIYLTDATTDNIVVDSASFDTTFVDLDSVFIVDSNVMANNGVIHRHEKIDCEGSCFAYVPQELCSHYLSDINLFAVCQLFIDDFNRIPNTGLLHSVPDTVADGFPEFNKLLNACITCNIPECDNRFVTANALIELFNTILYQL